MIEQERRANIRVVEEPNDVGSPTGTDLHQFPQLRLELDRVGWSWFDAGTSRAQPL